jgi:hypothetical protein
MPESSHENLKFDLFSSNKSLELLPDITLKLVYSKCKHIVKINSRRCLSDVPVTDHSISLSSLAKLQNVTLE